MSKYTPGPWVVAQRQLPADRKPDDCTELLHMDGYAIYVARNTLSDDPAADIALIAAAPAMYAALIECRDALAKCIRGEPVMVGFAHTAALDALAKAEGV